jgi:hypothetical protein
MVSNLMSKFRSRSLRCLASGLISVCLLPSASQAQSSGAFVVGSYRGLLERTVTNTAPQKVCRPVMRAVGTNSKLRVQVDVLEVEADSIVVNVSVPKARRFNARRLRLPIEALTGLASSQRRVPKASSDFKISRNSVSIGASAADPTDSGALEPALSAVLAVSDDATKSRGFCYVNFSGLLTKS